jgi:hypothetical protein
MRDAEVLLDVRLARFANFTGLVLVLRYGAACQGGLCVWGSGDPGMTHLPN